MFKEPTERELSLLPIVVHVVREYTEDAKVVREAGLGTCGMISFCVGGEGSFTDSFGRTHMIRSGDIIFFTPECPHSYEPVIKPWKLISILFSGCELNSICTSLNLPASGAIFPRDDNAALAREFVYKISAAYNSLDLYKHVTASVHLYNLLTLMSRCCISALKNLDAGVAKLVPAIQYIKANYDNSDLTSEMIASHSGISHPHLCRLFSAVYSMTPHEFLLNTRLGQAKAMLTENKNIPIRLIAQNTGFSSASYFTKVFKAKTGFTPAQFRHQTVYDF